MSKFDRLRQAIAALETQCAVLGDAIVDAALAPMREKLAVLTAQETPTEWVRRFSWAKAMPGSSTRQM